MSSLRTTITQISEKRHVPPDVIEAISKEVARIALSEKASYEAEISELRKSVGLLEADRNKLLAQKEALDSLQRRLSKENAKLRERIGVFEEERPKFSPSQLMLSLKEAMERMQEGLKTTEESRVDYTLSGFAVDVKANVGLDKDHRVIIQTPKLAEELPPQSLSTMHIELKAIPKLIKEKLAVNVPNLIGKKKETAIKAIDEAGLKLESVTERVSGTPAGIIIGQDPEPYGKASLGFPITLIVAKEPGVEVPNIVGVGREDAEKLLLELGLKLGQVKEEPVEAEPGVVLSQSIGPGTRVNEGSSIDLTVSRLAVVEVPDLVGKDRRTAVKEITIAGLKASTSRRRVREVKRGTVARQDPPPGTIVPVGSTVKIMVSA